MVNNEYLTLTVSATLAEAMKNIIDGTGLKQSPVYSRMIDVECCTISDAENLRLWYSSQEWHSQDLSETKNIAVDKDVGEYLRNLCTVSGISKKKIVDIIFIKYIKLWGSPVGLLGWWFNDANSNLKNDTRE